MLCGMLRVLYGLLLSWAGCEIASGGGSGLPRNSTGLLGVYDRGFQFIATFPRMPEC